MHIQDTQLVHCHIMQDGDSGRRWFLEWLAGPSRRAEAEAARRRAQQQVSCLDDSAQHAHFSVQCNQQISSRQADAEATGRAEPRHLVAAITRAKAA